MERELFALPVKLGGIGIIIPSRISDIQYTNSRVVTEDLTLHVKSQNSSGIVDPEKTKQIMQKIKNDKNLRNKAAIETVRSQLPSDKIKTLDAITELGASSWLTAIPIKAQGFYLNKQSFWDALRIRYNIPLEHLPSHCVCGNTFDIDHALSCHKGGFVAIRHNEIRDTTAELLSEVCKDVEIEPKLTPVTGEVLPPTAIITDDARADVSARGFWVRGSKAFLDVRIFNPIAKRYSAQSLSAAHRRNEKEKKRQYNDRIQHIEHGSFTPLVFSSFGGMAHECDAFYKRLANKLADKRDHQISVVTNWIRTKLSFSLLRSTLLCVRGSRSHKLACDRIADTDINLASAISGLK